MRNLFIPLIALALTTSLLAQEASPNHAVGGDFNGDGRADVAVGSSNGRVFLLLGRQGPNPLRAPQIHLLTGQPVDLIVGDFSGDGQDDLICNTGDRLVLLEGDRVKGFTEARTLPTHFSQIVSVVTGDFNGDDIPDLAVANWGPDTLTLLRGRGDGTFSPFAEKLPVEPFSVSAVDLDGDGIDELALSLVGSKKVVLARLIEDRLDMSGRLFFAGPIGYLTAGDFDGDGREDLGAVGNDKFWLVTHKRGQLEPPVSQSAGHEALLQFAEAADLDGDGKDELVSTDLRLGRVVLRSGVPVDGGIFAWRASAYDLNGDGKEEILIANVRHGTVTIIESVLDRPVKTIYNIDPNRPD